MARSDLRVFSGQILAVVTQLKHVLDINGIACEVRGEYRGAGLGEIPVTEAWPELWVLDAPDVENARRIVREALEAGESDQPAWECPSCHEIIEGQFGKCWSCGTKSDGQADA